MPKAAQEFKQANVGKRQIVKLLAEVVVSSLSADWSDESTLTILQRKLRKNDLPEELAYPLWLGFEYQNDLQEWAEAVLSG